MMPLDHLDGQRLDVDDVGHAVVGHDRGRIGVDQDRLDALLAQRAAGLGAGVVELGRLADDDRAGADDQHFLAVGSLTRPLRRRAAAQQLERSGRTRLVVLRAGAALGVVLDREDRQLAVAQPLDRAVVQVDVADVEAARRQRRAGVDLELVVLAW